MKISLRDILKKIGVIIMLCFVGLMITNKVMYTHVHKLEDGSLVVHAHPYDKHENEDSEETHHHSNAELYFLQSFELLFFVAVLSTVIVFGALILNLFICNIVKYKDTYILLSLGRSPPVL